MLIIRRTFFLNPIEYNNMDRAKNYFACELIFLNIIHNDRKKHYHYKEYFPELSLIYSYYDMVFKHMRHLPPDWIIPTDASKPQNVFLSSVIRVSKRFHTIKSPWRQIDVFRLHAWIFPYRIKSTPRIYVYVYSRRLSLFVSPTHPLEDEFPSPRKTLFDGYVYGIYLHTEKTTSPSSATIATTTRTTAAVKRFCMYCFPKTTKGTARHTVIERKFTVGIHKIITNMVYRWFYCGERTNRLGLSYRTL